MKRIKVFHFEVNGKTNTAEYVNKIIKATNEYCETDQCLKVFTSKDSYYDHEISLPVFKNYGSVSNPILKLFYYIIGFIKIFFFLRNQRDTSNILHLHWLRFSFFDLFILSLIRFSTDTLTVFTVHNVLPHEANFLDKRLYPLIYAKINAFTFHSVSSLEKFKHLTGNEPTEYFIIPHYGYNVSINKSPNFKKNKLLFFGTIRDYKGLDILLEACGHINTDIDWSLSVIGKPDIEMDRYRQISERNVISDRVDWKLGWIDEKEIDDIFNSHDIVVLPYKHVDNSGLIHLAMSYGKPVIASNLGSLSDLINDGENGLLFEANNVVQLKDCIQKLFYDEELKIRLGGNAKKIMDKHHSLNRIGALHSKLYNEMAIKFWS